MRKALAVVAILSMAGFAVAQWTDNFDSYPLGSINGKGGWQGWDNVPGAAGTVTNEQSFSQPNSQLIQTVADSVRLFPGVETGKWSFGTKVYVPTDFKSGGPTGTRGSYVILNDKYKDGGPYHWAVQIHFDSDTNTLIRDGTATSKATLPLIKGRWVDLRFDIDFTADTLRMFYDGTELGKQATWSKGVFEDPNDPGVKDLAAVDLFANSSSKVYYDDMYFTPEPTAFLMLLAGTLVLRRR